MREYTVSEKEEGLSLIKFSSRVLKEAPNGLLFKFLRNKNIELNGKKAESGAVLKCGDRVAFFLSDATFIKFHGHKADSAGGEEKKDSTPSLEKDRILYEDDDYLFYDKPAGLKTQGDGSGRPSLNDLLLRYTGTEEESLCRPSVCNRLDTNTSGIVLCGKSVKGLQSLSLAIKEHRIRKYYRAVLKGRVEGGGFVSFLSSSGDDNKVSVLDYPKNGYKEIITELQVIDGNADLTYAELCLLTGRKHQIRAQMAHIGHPVIGDRKYGREEKGASRQLLHSCRVSLPEDMLDGLTVTAPLPSDMERYLKRNGLRA